MAHRIFGVFISLDSGTEISVENKFEVLKGIGSAGARIPSNVVGLSGVSPGVTLFVVGHDRNGTCSRTQFHRLDKLNDGSMMRRGRGCVETYILPGAMEIVAQDASGKWGPAEVQSQEFGCWAGKAGWPASSISP